MSGAAGRAAPPYSDRMPLPPSARRDPAGWLQVGGCDLATLAAEHGTPLYVFDEQLLRERLRTWRTAVERWPGGGEVRYSAKAYFGLAMAALCVEEGCGVDVVSGGELETALRGGVAAADIAFPGNNKSADEVAAARAAGIGHLVVDSLHELDLVAGLPAGRPLPALLRLSPGVRPDTHAGIATGQLDSKFGFPIAGGAATAALERALHEPNLAVAGVHFHVGSQLAVADAVADAATVVAGWLADVRDRIGFEATVLSVGGGLGVVHTSDDRITDIDTFLSKVTTTLQAALEGRGLRLPRLHVEPGRSVAGPAAVAVYAVGARKAVPGVRTFLAVDGGMADNPRPQLYGARYEVLPVHDDPAVTERETVTVVGRYCETTDVIARDVSLPPLSPGALVVVPAAGAYTLAMASNYNSVPRPAVAFVAEGRARLVRRRETVDDLLATEVVAS